ncbi:hypothetical protein DL89DRAFT_255219 [Linderina pennispora]|uniref:Uncharacterized protein n=1 Tax=Linderina pennispora TaxID=61395 RepID=A0A1Y1WHS7_9FUNG|nr:uncharacterized protein DL89DRAFT_255219 [Linderina pennispora]ORX73073.1 hypothetical protein DL89DRAFT_255219 [Linderina pennispora]
MAPERILILGILKTSLLALACQVYFVTTLGKPIYHCMFNRNAYLDFFLRKMSEHNLTWEYNCADSSQPTDSAQIHGPRPLTASKVNSTSGSSNTFYPSNRVY